MTVNSSNTEFKSEYYAPYSEFSKTLRTWFVAYGIGGPVVLLANEHAWKAIVSSGCSNHIAFLFLIGGAFQVFSAYLNKHAMWHLYICEKGPDDTEADEYERQCLKDRRAYKISKWYSGQNWIDELLDFYTLIVLALATWVAFKVLSAPPDRAFLCNNDRSWCWWLIGIIAAITIGALRFIRALYISAKQDSAFKSQSADSDKGAHACESNNN